MKGMTAVAPMNKGSLSASYTNSLDTCFLCESQVKLLAFMHMGVEPTQDKPLQGRWPFKCTTFDEMVRDLADIMVDAAENLQSSITFFCCNTESHSSEAGRSGGLHWMSAVFEVIALGIAGRDGQQAAGSKRKERHRNIRARKRRQKGSQKRQVDPDCDLASSTSEEEEGGVCQCISRDKEHRGKWHSNPNPTWIREMGKIPLR